jgi:signal transduction histidine kinase
VVDRSGEVLSVNAKGKELFGSQRLDPVRWPALWESRDAAERAFQSAARGESARFQSRGGLSDFTGSFWDVVVSPIRDARGCVERVLGVARDVTELQRLNTELSATLRLNETFVAAIGHDLRTPLNNVVMSAELLSTHAQSPSDVRVIERLRASALRMSKMIDELFDLARARLSGGIPVSPEDGIDLVTVAERIIGELSSGEPARAPELSHAGSTLGRFDSDRLGQVLANLLGNALRHGQPELPIALTIDGSSPHEVVLTVTNYGEIPNDILSCLFQPFRRGATRRGSTQGLGLGLFIVEQIVLAHQGRITATSGDGVTTFRVVLPRGAETSAQASV